MTGRVWEDAFQAGRERSVRKVRVTAPHRGSEIMCQIHIISIKNIVIYFKCQI